MPTVFVTAKVAKSVIVAGAPTNVVEAAHPCQPWEKGLAGHILALMELHSFVEANQLGAVTDIEFSVETSREELATQTMHRGGWDYAKDRLLPGR